MSTYTSTFTATHAHYLATKVAADLKQMQLFYGEPTDAHIADLLEELTLFLKAGYLQSIDYGYKRDGKFVVGVSYEVSNVTGQLIDQSPGRITQDANVTGASFSSYRRPNAVYHSLTPRELEAFNNSNPIKWVNAPDPQAGLFGVHDKTYSAGGKQLTRKTF